MDASARPLLIIVPGIGDDAPIYRQFVQRWNRLGFETHVVPFGWADTQAPFEETMPAFLARLDQFGDRPLYLIGISAGGTAAINALAVRSTIQRVITICSPLQTMPRLRNPLLAASVSRVMSNLAAFTPEQKRRIVSVHALYDQVVDVRLSKAPGIRAFRLWSVWHAPTIYLAMVPYAHRLKSLLT